MTKTYFTQYDTNIDEWVSRQVKDPERHVINQPQQVWWAPGLYSCVVEADSHLVAITKAEILFERLINQESKHHQTPWRKDIGQL